ncbi:tripartite tricarboxylate transporter substrate binding protein [Siccirubricoccus sp. G192]|uniref:tripartite tricarboxylate transporter substrate binding protein n=1 Tax=Siccirubricoccus sp. G192 TaxID=2849651 RepID=UPI001C2BEE02|nr:tripartite tricarboxylate transporter substrate binding protein [Siccirubricoccus sp. G192]MBV1797452.1 tripartite tricarboxylate transporter substrate binding protein [Siccirubricoccus sp. G192]
MPATTLRRRGLLALAAAAPLARPAIAQQGFPSRPIRMLVPWAPGGTTDIQMRALCDAASRKAGVPVVVDNKSGAGGILGAQALLTEKPDGYALSQMPVSVFRYPVMSSRPPFDPMKDFTYITHLTGYTFGVVVRADSPWKTWQEFLDYAKKNPGKVDYGTPGVGTSLHITMERIAEEKGIDWTHIPFRGFAENIQALLGKQIDATVDTSGWAELVQGGQVRLLVVWTAERAKRFPDVPTLRETGTDIVSASPYGFAGPKGMDPGVVKALDDIFKEALYAPTHLAVLDRYDMPVMYKGPEEYAAFARQQMEEDRAMIEKLGLKIN